MDVDSTVPVAGIRPIRVEVERGQAEKQSAQFYSTVRIGRDPECELRLLDQVVSRVHAELRFDGGVWKLVDTESINGTFHNGQRVREVVVSTSSRVELGPGGPLLRLSVGERPLLINPIPIPKRVLKSVTQVLRHYGRRDDGLPGSPKTMLFRQAFARVLAQQRRRYKILAAAVAVLGLAVAITIFWHQRQLENLRAAAVDMFFSMKSMELQLAQLEELVVATADGERLREATAKRQELRELEKRYEQFVRELGVYDDLTPEELAIFETARAFGECDAMISKDFLREVQRYIKKWQSTHRLERAIRQARNSGYVQVVGNVMREQSLSPDFFYLALQESNFNPRAVGPRTRFGYAKGIWQFIPATAEQYGLKLGPRFATPAYDPKDERFHFRKATRAAARYLRRIYTTEAQASGLLVMASYNWGEGNVVANIREMPLNPRERNFWKLLDYGIPSQTHDYVFYIISAAVIGRRPELFGFPFQRVFSEE